MNKFKKFISLILIVELLACNSICYAKTTIEKEIKNQQLILKRTVFELENYKYKRDVSPLKAYL